MTKPANAQDAADLLTAPTPEPTSEYRWDICNETSFILRTAHGMSENGEVILRGWKDVNPGACLTEMYTDPNAPRFLYAESLPLHRGGIREWKGTVELCASPDPFEAKATDECALNNLETQLYLAVRPSESRTTLIEPAEYGGKAETAAIQRLLRDAGYQVTKIDGLPGRRTSKSLAEFKKDAELDKNVDGEALINALRDAAQESIKAVGIELCNDGTSKIWSAIAIREDGSWQSRGWWDVEPESCTHMFTKPLDGTEAHIYALQENIDPENPREVKADKRLRSISATPAQFCIAESRFSALGREFCAEGGYTVANFRPVPTEEDGVKITLNDADFAEIGAAGLRR
ncbi:DUF1036 domain-containing protein [Litorimonas sp. RW-G-Af-16]|uniref:DUF1036 domain-containing protein n=1 Tax=Litorimonas sp. RW-G-Af-16 TaxID=3241168 RepID=UPI00390C5494